MRALTKLYPAKEITRYEIDGSFEKYGKNVPDEIVELIINYGGCRTKEHHFKNDYVINNFLPLKSKENTSIIMLLEMFKNNSDNLFRNDLIPIAIDPGGGPFYYSIKSSDFGYIYKDRMGSSDSGPIIEVAKSLTEFLEGIY